MHVAAKFSYMIKMNIKLKGERILGKFIKLKIKKKKKNITQPNKPENIILQVAKNRKSWLEEL